MKYRYLLVMLSVIFIVPSVYAVSISPGMIDVAGDEGGLEDSYTIRVTNPGDATVMIMNYTGPLSKYMELDMMRFNVSKNERREVTLTVDIPDNHGLVGPQNNLVRAQTQDVSGGGLIQVQTSVATRFEVFFPYPGRYLEIDDFKVSSVEIGEDTSVSWNVINRGEETSNMEWELSVRNDGQVLYTSSGSTSIEGERSEDFSENIPSSQFNLSEYDVDLVVEYEEDIVDESDSFRVGEAGVDLLSFYPKTFQAGIVNGVKLGTSNQWPNPLDNVRASIQIDDYITTTPTLEELKGVDDKLNGQHNFAHFLDLSEFEPGEYEAKITFRFESDGEPDSTSYTRNITLVEELDSPNQPQNSQESVNNPIIMFLIIITVLITLFGLAAIFMIYGKNKKNED